MQFALVNGERREAGKGLSGICIGCGQAMTPKCGNVKVKHWAHNSKCDCDHWWESETEWHRAWKGQFPILWQEILHIADSGERHFADVKTEQGWVIEFQNSAIHPDERLARDSFYEKLVWVINGKRRERYEKQFFQALEDGISVTQKPLVKKVYLAESSLLNEWSNCRAPVFVDFGNDHPLWCFLPESRDAWVYLIAISRNDFLDIHRAEASKSDKGFEKIINMLREFITAQKALSKIQSSKLLQSFPDPLKLQPRFHKRF